MTDEDDCKSQRVIETAFLNEFSFNRKKGRETGKHNQNCRSRRQTYTSGVYWVAVEDDGKCAHVEREGVLANFAAN
jgi:hypothetical protein